MRIGRLFLVALCAPLFALAAENPKSAAEAEAGDETEVRIINPQINSWAEGTIVKLASGELVLKGTDCPFATAHAQMRQQMQQQLRGIEDPQQRLQTIRQVKEQWRDKLNAALEQKRGAEAQKEFTFKQPADKDELVVLDGKDIRELPFFRKLAAVQAERKERGLDEMTLVEAYKAHEARVAARAETPIATTYDKGARESAAEKAGEKMKERVGAAREKLAAERLSLSELKAGDKVFVGYNSKDNTAYSVIKGEMKHSAQPASQPAQAR